MTYNQKPARDRFAEAHPKYGMDRYRWLRFGLSPEQFAEMKRLQDNLCFVCRQPEPGHRKGVRKELAVDHNRYTGQVRKLLCSQCNCALGLLQEDPARITALLEYLRIANGEYRSQGASTPPPILPSTAVTPSPKES